MSLTVQFTTMISMIIMGGWIGLALDTYGRFLKRPNRVSWFVFVNDILFWIVQALLVFYVLLYVNEGEIRFYIWLAMLCGYAAYQSLFKSLYLKLLEILIKLSIRIYQFFYRLLILIIVRPIQALIKLLIVIGLFLGNVAIKIFQLTLKLLNLTIKIVITPFKWIFQLIWRFFSQKNKIFLLTKAGILINIKNTLLKWWKKIRK
ncbi:spore cortex biosynthesis protein YabQ [Bacillus sp. Marseille-P3661]|uniref:spore cortex biosynthesis protein YabQ n=1 Tax=Bacillus sp. Marseille-P3661 TaxID=1936234 RepID=UPI000C8682C7|nr:spore cortex biosynthesis protein YabQ [Bacillus sp. Marseille-P3661]